MVKSLKSQLAGVIIFIMALVTQLNHAQNVSWLISKKEWLDLWSSWGVAVALETTVLYAVINGQKPFSYVFALISILINVAYYESSMKPGHSMFFLTDFSSNWPRWIFSVIVPVAIAFYSHVIVKFVEGERKESNKPLWIVTFAKNLLERMKDGRAREVTTESTNSGIEDLSVGSSPGVTEHENGDGTRESRIPEKYRPIVDYLQSNSPANRATLVKNTRIAPQTLFREDEGETKGYLVELQEMGLIHAEKNGARVLYSLNGANA